MRSETAASSTLTAVRRSLPAGTSVDPYAIAGATGIVFDTGSRLLVGVGSALTIPLPHGLTSSPDLDTASRTLASIPCVDHSGSSGSPIMAFAALPFDRSESTALVVPELIYGRDTTGDAWVTVIGHPGTEELWADGMARLLQGPPSGAVPAGNSGAATDLRDIRDTPSAQAVIRPLSSDADFLDVVAQALTLIDQGELSKVVLARQIEVELGEPVDLPSLLTRWRAMEPSCTIFSMPTPGGRFIGASPELLVEREGDQVRSRPLAGSTGEVSDLETAKFRSSSKEIREHRWVTDAIGDALAPFCSILEVPEVPDLVRLHTIVHLGTDIRGVLRRCSGVDGSIDDGADAIPTVLALLAALHPTPAVGGVPAGRALRAIATFERQRRGPYAGPVGYIDGDGNGQWVVGIRAVHLLGRIGTMAAGVGVVSGSEPGAELSETMLKFRAVLHALVPGQCMPTVPLQDEAAGRSRLPV